MRVLTVYAHPNPKSFCHAILEQFTKGLKDGGHTSEVVDLYAIRFNPVLTARDYPCWIDDFGFRYPGIKQVELVYFYSVAAVGKDVRRGYLQEAYRFGREFSPS